MTSSLGSIGLVGLPNVGKSALFNAFVGQKLARSENYPFCTIQPTFGKAIYRDPRLATLVQIVRPQRVTAARLSVVDIAGLVEGASNGAGLGNQFLAHVRDAALLVDVVRCFDMTSGTGAGVVHTLGRVDPVRDVHIVEHELAQRDLQLLAPIVQSKRLPSSSAHGEAAVLSTATRDAYLSAAQCAHDALAKNGRLFPSDVDSVGWPWLRDTLRLLSVKPVVYAANVDESALRDGNTYANALHEHVLGRGGNSVVVRVSAAIESDLAAMTTTNNEEEGQEKEEEQRELAALYGLINDTDLEHSDGGVSVGVQRVLRVAQESLRIAHFFTQGAQEVRAWSFRRGATARQCSARIHSDFPRLFVRAEHWRYADFVRDRGRRSKPVFKAADYVALDGDLFDFKLAQPTTSSR